MNIWCGIFGHAPLTTAGWQGGVGYAFVGRSGVDGLNTKHLYLEAECPRCDKTYRICNVHQPETEECGK